MLVMVCIYAVAMDLASQKGGAKASLPVVYSQLGKKRRGLGVYVFKVGVYWG